MEKLYRESVAFAFSQLQGDRFRTFLSLLGVSIGIFSIVAIFTAIDALKENVKKGFESMSPDVVMVSQWPMMGEDEEGNAERFRGTAVQMALANDSALSLEEKADRMIESAKAHGSQDNITLILVELR